MSDPVSTDLVSTLLNGNRRSLARAVSIVENGEPESENIIREVFPRTKGIRVIGITGSPGAGKSTLTDRIAREYLSRGLKIAIIAVDPSSPFTGGALLGDRIRMVSSGENKEVFIRSMATRGALGGLAPRTKEVIYLLDAAGFDLVLIETVGVGQGEVEIVRTADSVIVVLVPGMGDGVQALKAGILEIADLYAINKADYDGVELLEKELITLLGLTMISGWEPKVLRTVSTTGQGITELASALDEHQKYLSESGAGRKRKELFTEEYLRDAVTQIFISGMMKKENVRCALQEEVKLILERKSDPVSSKQKILKLFAPS